MLGYDTGIALRLKEADSGPSSHLLQGTLGISFVSQRPVSMSVKDNLFLPNFTGICTNDRIREIHKAYEMVYSQIIKHLRWSKVS